MPPKSMRFLCMKLFLNLSILIGLALTLYRFDSSLDHALAVIRSFLKHPSATLDTEELSKLQDRYSTTPSKRPALHSLDLQSSEPMTLYVDSGSATRVTALFQDDVS